MQGIVYSAAALHVYERASIQQQKAVSSILAGGKGDFKDVVKGDEGKNAGNSGTEKQQP